MSVIHGFGGLRVKEEGVSLNPVLPKQWSSYQFRFKLEDACVLVTIGEKVTIETDKKISLILYGEKYEIAEKLEVDYVIKY